MLSNYDDNILLQNGMQKYLHIDIKYFISSWILLIVWSFYVTKKLVHGGINNEQWAMYTI